MPTRMPAIIVALLLITACSQQSAPLRIGTTPWPGYEFLHMAQELGYFEQEGVRVQLVDFLSLADSSRAFERGQVDIWGSTLVELALSRTQSQRHAKAFLVTNESAGGDVILARQPISSIEQLRGKRVAVEPSTVDVVLLHHALKQAGMALTQVELVPLAQAEMPAALESGQLDAVCTYPPNSVHISRSPAINRIFDSNRIPDIIIDVLATDANIIEQRAEELAAISRAFFRAQQYASSNPAEANRMLARWTQISELELQDVLAGIRIISRDEQADYLTPGTRIEQAIDSTMAALTVSGLNGPFGTPASLYTDSVIKQLNGH